MFVPREFNGAFMTLDKTEYRRDRTTGTIRRATPKLKGKARRRAERLARRLKRGDDS